MLFAEAEVTLPVPAPADSDPEERQQLRKVGLHSAAGSGGSRASGPHEPLNINREQQVKLEQEFREEQARLVKLMAFQEEFDQWWFAGAEVAPPVPPHTGHT